MTGSNSAHIPLWTPEQLQASQDALLSQRDPGDDVWIYAYGSLIWRPDFPFLERRAATLVGHHRALCLWSCINRGTPEQPGLVFGLDLGGSCHGMAYRIDASQIDSIFPRLWQREMSTGCYQPSWLRCSSDTGDIRALSFVMNRSHPGYITGLSQEEQIAIILGASGSCGPCSDYVLETAKALRQANILDEQLDRLARQLEPALRTRQILAA
ncbi:gamma-glutamylcyclotransferase [Kerstersia similis]|uniref:gamma-glutamylcyclotransferase n=1 Tax=Kerstersia similis TaxID=206505 RepID=UPI0039F0FD09